jgi:hypothetical protein
MYWGKLLKVYFCLLLCLLLRLLLFTFAFTFVYFLRGSAGPSGRHPGLASPCLGLAGLRAGGGAGGRQHRAVIGLFGGCLAVWLSTNLSSPACPSVYVAGFLAGRAADALCGGRAAGRPGGRAAGRASGPMWTVLCG